MFNIWTLAGVCGQNFQGADCFIFEDSIWLNWKCESDLDIFYFWKCKYFKYLIVGSLAMTMMIFKPSVSLSIFNWLSWPHLRCGWIIWKSIAVDCCLDHSTKLKPLIPGHILWNIIDLLYTMVWCSKFILKLKI